MNRSGEVFVFVETFDTSQTNKTSPDHNHNLDKGQYQTAFISSIYVPNMSHVPFRVTWNNEKCVHFALSESLNNSTLLKYMLYLFIFIYFFIFFLRITDSVKLQFEVTATKQMAIVHLFSEVD